MRKFLVFVINNRVDKCIVPLNQLVLFYLVQLVHFLYGAPSRKTIVSLLAVYSLALHVCLHSIIYLDISTFSFFEYLLRKLILSSSLSVLFITRRLHQFINPMQWFQSCTYYIELNWFDQKIRNIEMTFSLGWVAHVFEYILTIVIYVLHANMKRFWKQQHTKKLVLLSTRDGEWTQLITLIIRYRW